MQRAFTLIELSIVLVIIGLIIGGVLLGQSLIQSSEIRATITQIEKYNQAANTFRGKYGYLPGDIVSSAATQFGFAARGPNPGEGDGNGIIQTWNGSGAQGNALTPGEPAMFWVDLSTAGLIEGTYNTATSTIYIAPPGIPLTGISAYLPPAKIGRGQYVYVYSLNGINYYGLSEVNAISTGGSGGLQTAINLPVSMAYSIDLKTDDGLPQSGRVMAMGLHNSSSDYLWANNYDNSGITYTSATASTGTNCYNNSSNNGGTQQYSLSLSGAECILSFQFQ